MNFTSKIALLLLVTAAVANANTKPGGEKNILIYFGFGSYSMRISVWPLIEGLVEQGHNVTFLSPFHPKSPHGLPIHEFVPKQASQYSKDMMEGGFDVVEERKHGGRLGKFLVWYHLIDMVSESCRLLFEDQEVQDWLKSDNYDLVIVDSFNDCGYGLAHHFKAKIMAFHTCAPLAATYESFGIPDEGSWIIDMQYEDPPFKQSFLGRVASAVNPVAWKWVREYWLFPMLEKSIKKGLGVDTLPSIRELEKNVTISLLTTHYAQEYARVLPPNAIPIGGLVTDSAAMKKGKKLPKEMEDFINKGKNGFVFVSFGTVLDFTKLDDTMQKNFIDAFLQFPDIQFIWKAAKGVGRDMPKNFLITKWAPQQELLAHPKIKAFITHGGMGSYTEGVHHGVPLLAFPLLGDQDYNANFVEPRGIGIAMEVNTFTAAELKDAISRITTDETYKRNMKKVSNLFQDRPMSPRQTAVWWTEFVLRHDAEEIHEFMRVRNMDQPWYVKRQLDAWAFVVVVLLTILLVPTYIIYYVFKSLVFGSSGKSNVGKKVKRS